jgi:hypothetical protein
MRKISLLWLLLAAISGGVLFHTSQQVNDGRQRLAVINEDIHKEDETIRVLQAEWSYLNQPDRLEKLSKQYLHLAPLNGRQFAKLDTIGNKPVEAPAPVATPEKTPVAEATPEPRAEETAKAEETKVEETPAVAEAAAVAKAEETKAEEPKPAPKPVVAVAPPKPTPAHVKRVPIKTTSAFITGLHKPAAAQKTPKPVATASEQPGRNFGDVMKSLGVH